MVDGKRYDGLRMGRVGVTGLVRKIAVYQEKQTSRVWAAGVGDG